MRRKIFDRYSLFLLSLFVVTILCLNVFTIGRYLNSDMYGDMWVAKLMWEQKTLFPYNWVFGNQIYILATPNLASVIYGMSGNMMISMSMASCIMVCLILYSFVYCFRACYEKNTILYGLTAFFSCFICYRITNNEFGQLFFTGSTFYSCYIITLLISLGSYLRVKQQGIRKQWLVTSLSAFLSLVMGLQSLRQTMIMVLPFLVFEAVYEGKRVKRKQSLNMHSIEYVSIVSICNIVGVLLSKQLPVNKEEIFGGLGISMFHDISGKAISMLSCMSSLFGLHDLYMKIRYGSEISLFDVFPIIGTIALVALFVAIIYLLIKRQITKNDNALACICILILGILGTVAVFWILDIDRLAKYLFVFFLFVPALFMLVYENLSVLNRKKMERILGTTAILIWVTAYASPLVQMFTIKTPYDEAASYMQENGYKIVYAVWDDTGPLAGASNCSITAGRWDASSIFKIKSHTNVKGIYSDEDNKMACYLFNRDNHRDAEAYLGDDFSLLHLLGVWKDGSNELFLYYSDKQLMYE